MRLEYIPVIGFFVAIVRHIQACRRHSKERTWEAYEATWAAFHYYHIALACTFIPFILIVLFIALRY